MEESCASAVTFKLCLQKPLGVQGSPSKTSKQRKRRAEKHHLFCFNKAAFVERHHLFLYTLGSG